MTKFLVNIWAYNYHAKFEVESEDNPQSLEQSIVDKLGENVIKWENLGISYDNKVNRITYEEVINDDATAHPGTLQQEGESGPTMEARAS